MAKKKENKFFGFLIIWIAGFVVVNALALIVPQKYYAVATVILISLGIILKPNALKAIHNTFRVNPKKLVLVTGSILALLAFTGTTPGQVINGTVLQAGNFLPLGAITGVQEAGAIFVTQDDSDGVAFAITLQDDTILEPNGSLKFKVTKGYNSLVNVGPTPGAELRLTDTVDPAETALFPFNYFAYCNVGGCGSATTPQAALQQAPTQIIPHNHNLFSVSNNPKRASFASIRTVAGNELNLAPPLKVWRVDERCANLQDYFPAVKTFTGGSIINNSQFTFLGQPVEPAFYCYNQKIVKYKPNEITEDSVIEYDEIERGNSVTLPANEVWVVPFNIAKEDVALAPSCSPDNVADAESGVCTVDIQLITECGGAVDFTTGTCVTQGANPCPPGQLLLVDETGTKTCVLANSVTFNENGDKFVCGVGFILNENTFLCESPSSLSAFLCDTSQINAQGICTKPPEVTCAVPEKEWSGALALCIDLPANQADCDAAGFLWNDFLKTCSVQPIAFNSANPSAACNDIGGTWDSLAGVCILVENNTVPIPQFIEIPSGPTGAVIAGGSASFGNIVLVLLGSGALALGLFTFTGQQKKKRGRR